MVFVTVGTQDKNFDRLISYVFKLLEDGIIKDDVIVQKGISNYDTNRYDNIVEKSEYNIQIFDFCDSNKMEEYIKVANYVIIHGGVGTITSCLISNKKTIVVPRLKKYDEHENDHQLEIVNKFNELNYILLANNYDELKDCVANISNTEFSKFKANNDQFVVSLEKIIDEI